jgi:hypothetical protein
VNSVLVPLRICHCVPWNRPIRSEAQYCELKAKRGEERTESSKSGILSERKKEGTFSCTDYGKWM